MPTASVHTIPNQIIVRSAPRRPTQRGRVRRAPEMGDQHVDVSGAVKEPERQRWAEQAALTMITALLSGNRELHQGARDAVLSETLSVPYGGTLKGYVTEVAAGVCCLVDVLTAITVGGVRAAAELDGQEPVEVWRRVCAPLRLRTATSRGAARYQQNMPPYFWQSSCCCGKSFHRRSRNRRLCASASNWSSRRSCSWSSYHSRDPT